MLLKHTKRNVPSTLHDSRRFENTKSGSTLFHRLLFFTCFRWIRYYLNYCAIPLSVNDKNSLFFFIFLPLLLESESRDSLSFPFPHLLPLLHQSLYLHSCQVAATVITPPPPTLREPNQRTGNLPSLKTNAMYTFLHIITSEVNQD